MTDGGVTNVLLRAQVDQSAAENGVRALQKIKAASDSAVASFLEINKAAGLVSTEVKRLQVVSDEIAQDQSLRNIITQYAEMAKLTGDAEGQAINLRKAIREIGGTESDVKKATAAFYELANAQEKSAKAGSQFTPEKGRRFGSVLTSVGLGAIGQPVEQISSIALIIKDIQKLGEATGLMATAAPAAAAGATATAGGLTAMAAAAAPLLLVLAPVVLAIIALKLALDSIQKGATDAAAAEKAGYDAQQAQDELDAKNKADIRTKTPEQVRQEASDAFDVAARKSDEIVAKKAEIAANAQAYTALGSSFNPAARAQLGSLGEQLQKDLDDLIKKETQSFAANQNSVTNVLPAVEDIATQAQAAKDLIATNEELIKSRQEERQAMQLSLTAAQGRVTSLRDDQKAIEQARDALLKSGDTSQAVTDKIAEYNKLLARNGEAQTYLMETAIPLIKAREEEVRLIKEGETALASYNRLRQQADQIATQINQMEDDRAKTLARRAEQDQITTERAGITKDYTARIQAAKADAAIQDVKDKVAQENADKEVQRQEKIASINSDGFDAEIKAYADFKDKEQQLGERANLQRLQEIERASLDLKVLASRGDVAAFVERSNAAKLQIKEQTETSDLAAKQRQADFEKQINDSRVARQKQIDDLNRSFEQEKAIRDRNAEERILTLEQEGNAANSIAAQLEEEYNNIKEQWRADDLQRQRDQEQQDFDERLALQQERQGEILSEADAFWQSWLNIVRQTGVQSDPNNPGDIAYNAPLSENNGQPFSTGIDYIPRNNYPVRGDLGERILTARENRDYTYGGGRGGKQGDTYSATVYATVGDVASKTYVDALQQETVRGLKTTMRRTRGRGATKD